MSRLIPLAKLPPTPHPLPRSLGMLGVLFLTLSAATPASSVFVIVPGMFQVAGTGALWAFALAGLVCVATAFIYAELSSAFPVAGGEYVMVARTLGPLPGFVILGVNLVNNMLFAPVVGLGVSAVLGTLIPGLPPVPIAVLVVAGATLCALLNIRVNALVTGLFLLVEVAALLVLVALGLVDPVRPLAPMLAHPVMAAGATLVPATPAAIGLATTIAIFALNGYGMAVYFGEEMHEAPRRIARVILVAFALTLLFELAPVAAALIGAPDLPNLLSAEDPFGAFARLRGGGALAALVAIAVVIAILNAAIVTLLAAARFLYATARDLVWGARGGAMLGTVHYGSGTPRGATLAVGAVGIAGCFVSLPFLLILSGGGLIVTYVAIALAAIVGRSRGGTAHALYRMPLFPLAPLVTLAALGFVGWTNWQDPAEGRPAMIATLAQMGLAAAYYVLVLRRRGEWIVRDG